MIVTDELWTVVTRVLSSGCEKLAQIKSSSCSGTLAIIGSVNPPVINKSLLKVEY